jgi:hypothetical protein
MLHGWLYIHHFYDRPMPPHRLNRPVLSEARLDGCGPRYRDKAKHHRHVLQRPSHFSPPP